MKSNCSTVTRILFSIKPLCTIFSSSPTKLRFYSTLSSDAAASQSEKLSHPASDIFREWGCTEADIHRIFTRRPKLRYVNLPNLESKLGLLRGLGIQPSDLATIIQCRPRFIGYRVNRFFQERLDNLQAFFGSREMLIKAIVRNPSLLTNDFQKTVGNVVEMYAQLGIGKSDLVSLLLSRPTLIGRSKLCEEKIDYIRKTGVSRETKLYKHVVAIIASSRVETIQKKLANYQKFGVSETEILKAIGRSPFLLALSTEKVDRNMKFVVGVLKMPVKVALDQPFLLFFSLEATLKPRMLLAAKIDEMNLAPRIEEASILTVLRMEDTRFMKVYISCHPPEISQELMEFYKNAQGVKRLAVSSKHALNKGFPF